MATIFLYHQKVKFVYSANLLLGKRVLLSALFLLCFIGLSGATSAFVGTPPAGNVAETQTSEPPKNSDDEQNWSAVFESPLPLAQDWRQYAARDEVKPALQTPGRIVLERTPLSHYPIQILLLTLQANNIQVRETWQVSNAIHAFDINNDGELYLTADDESATLVATVYLIDNFQMLNKAYQNLTASAVITVEVMSGDLSVEQPKRLEVVAGMAEEVYVFDVHGGNRPHTYTLLHNPDDNAFAFSNGTLSVNVSATIGEYRFTVEVADAGNMSVTVAATVSVAMAATIRIAGGGAVFVVQGQEQEVGDGEAISFNPRSQSGVMVSVKAAATVALTAPDDSWQITLYGGGEAFFAGVADADSDDLVVGVSLMGDSDFVRNTDEKVALAYVFSDEVIVPVEPQGTRIFCRSYGGQWYLVIDEGVAEVLDQGAIADVNFLAFGDDVRWNLNGTLFKEEKPFTFDDFMETVAYRYIGEVGEVQANDGVAPSFSLVGDSDVFAVTMWSGLKSGQWLPGLLAIIEGQEGPLALSVTVAATDHLGDMLGDYGYANRMATVAVKVKVAAPPLVLSTSEAQPGTVGIKSVLLAFTADGGVPPYAYSIVPSNDSDYFDITDSGELSVLEDAVAGVYTLSIMLRDSMASSAVVAVTVTIQEGASRIFVLGGTERANTNIENLQDDVWSAADGANWSRETDGAGWSRRYAHQALSHNGQLYVLGGYDSKNLNLNDVWSSADGQNWSRETDNAEWAGRSDHQAVSHNGRLYVLGGDDGSSSRLNDVWSSADGKSWVLETNDANWSRRYLHQAVSHNGRLYVLGGNDYSNNNLNDVWSSADGKNWVLETDGANWSQRNEHQAVSHNGRLYVLGGLNLFDNLNDVWSSADGKSWVLETDGAKWARRFDYQALSHNGRLYVLGGCCYLNDVWSSADGKSWALETDGANWSKRWSHQAVVFPPELALFGVGERLTVSGRIAANLHTFTAQYGRGGYSYSLGGEIDGFSVNPSGVLSTDGNAATGEYTLTVWVEDGERNRAQTAVKVFVPFIVPFNLAEVPPLAGLAGIAKDLHTFTTDGDIPGEQYMIVAGNTQGYFALDADSGVLSLLTTALEGVYTLSVEVSDSLSSSNKATAAATVEIRGKQIFVLGGFDDNNYLSDVWSAADSKVWLLETATAGWSGREEHQALSHKGRIYVMGGGVDVYEQNAVLKNDVWSSEDGKTWRIETAAAGWSPRALHQALSHKGRIYVLGGSRGEYGEYKNDVWSSADGQNWVLETAAADWSVRSGHQALSHNGRIYVLGGYDPGTGSKNDVWSSADGQNWRLENGSADWQERDIYEALSYKGRIYVLGGVNNDEDLNDVWSSADGQTWRLETAAADWSAREDHQALSYNGRIYVLGGYYYDAVGDNDEIYNDVWSSVDGQTWRLETNSANWSKRADLQAVVFPSELILLGVGERLTVSAGIAANLHTLTAQYGKGNYTYSLNPVVSGFDVSPGGVLSTDGTAAPGEYTLTIWVADNAGNQAQTAVKVFVHYFNLVEVPPLFGLAGIAKVLHTFTTDSGIVGGQYTIVAGNEAGYFALDADSGVLSLLAQAVENVYILLVEVSDSSSSSSKATVTATVEIRGKQIFVLGGNDGQDSSNDGQDTSNNLNDVWFSGDGANWVRETDDAGWSRRLVHQALSHNGQLYVLGGYDGNNLNDVWSSADGQNWVLETNAAGWAERFDHQAVSHNGRLYVLGGDDDTNLYNDVWSSADGKSWVLETNAASWSRRYLHQAVSHNGRLYVLGGGDGSKNDVWSSADGKNWVLETDDASWSRRFDHQALSHNGRLYVLGGNDDTNLYNDVWSSADGKSWALETATANWSRRSEHQALSHNGRLYVLGGDDGSDQNDVWSSADGQNWSLETDGANWSKRWGHQAVVFPPPLVLFGVGERLTVSAGIAADLHTFTAQYGKGNYTYSLNPVVSGFAVGTGGVLSANGTAATGEYTLTIWVADNDGNQAQTAVKVFVPFIVPFNLVEVPPLFGLAGIAKVLHTFTTDSGIVGGQYTIVAGNDQNYFALADSGVLSLRSIAWEGVYTLLVEVSDSSFSSSKATVTATVEIKGKQIFVLGGYDGSNRLNDVWFSADGANWRQETANAEWSQRPLHQALSHNGMLYVLGGYDGNNRNDVWSSADGQNWSLETNAAGWAGRYDHQALSHNGRLYVLGGDDNTNFYNDVWSSADGKSWVQETDDANWSKRAIHQSVSYNGRLYVLGGEDDDDLNDVWSSADGKNWVQETDDAEWAERYEHQALSHNGRLYVLGGEDDDDNLYNDVWSSADGKNWVLETAAASWSRRNDHQALSHNGRLYVLGGSDDDNLYNDVWSSADGKTWTQVTDGANWSKRRGHQAVVFPSELILLGVGERLTVSAGIAADLHTFTAQYGKGNYTYSLNPVVSGFAVGTGGVLSTDGTAAPGEYNLTIWVADEAGDLAQTAVKVFVPYFNLAEVPHLAGFAGIAKVLHTFATDSGIVGGQYTIVEGNEAGYFALDADSGVLSLLAQAVEDVYTLLVEVSDSSFSSSKATVTATVEIRGKQIFVLGGYDDTNLYNDVWFSADGANWRQETANAEWSRRLVHQALSHNGQLYVLGGGDSNGLNDVWSSADGKNWVLETDDASWSRRFEHQSVSHNGRLYVLGGDDDTNRYNDVWSSADGKNWVLETDDASWSRRYLHQALSHNGRLYVLGGSDDNHDPLNDVWSSADGKSWVLETAHAKWSRRFDHQALSHNGRLYVLGGNDDTNLYNDVWSSADGKNWVLETDDANWSRRYLHQAVSHNGRLYVLGGDDGSDKNDVWSWAEGESWSLNKANDGNGWAARWGHQAVVFPPPLALFGVGERLTVIAGIAADLHTFTARYGVGQYTYSLSPAVVGFSIDNNGILFADGSIVLGDYTLTVRVEDQDGSRAETVVRVEVVASIAVLSLADAPPLFVIAGLSESVSLHAFTVSHGIGVSTYSLVDDSGYFALDTASGVLSVSDNVAVGVYTVSVAVRDARGYQAAAVATVEAVPMLFLATVPTLTVIVGRVAHTLVASGGIGALTYTILADETGYFVLDAASGVLSLQGNAPVGIYTLSIAVDDEGGNRAEALAVVAVTVTLTAAVPLILQDPQEDGASRIFVLGGSDDVYGTGLNDVWSATDGKVWSMETATAGWSRREEHQALSHNGRIYVLGGGVSVYYENPILKNDVWSSTDGKTWMQETATAGWSVRSSHQALSHNGRIYVLGGARGENERGNVGEYKNDVWSSADGKVWSLETAADWSARSGHQALSHNGRIYVLGGFKGVVGKLNDVWSSADGKNWSLETGNANWPIRNLHQALSHKGRIYVLGGISNNDETLNDVWSSAYGQTWRVETDDADWSVRDSHQALSYNGRIYVLGGLFYEDDNNDLYNDVWSSVDGQTWTLETNSANWSKRAALQAVVFPPEPDVAE